MNKEEKENIDSRKYKILLLGDSQVGKTVFYQTIFPQEASEHHLSTIGVQFNSKNIAYEGKYIQLEIWDTAGQERYRAITKNFFKGADGILLFYDITNRETFANIKKWIKVIKEILSLNEIYLILLGNKIDKANQRKVEIKEGVALATSFNGRFLETSGQTGENVNEAITNLMELLVSKSIINGPKAQALSIINKETNGNYCSCT